MNLTSIKIEQKWLVLIAVGMSTFMSALDTSVVNVVLPIITKTFNSHIATVEWVVIIYLLIVSGLLLSFGRLGDIRGHKPVFLIGFSVFIISSALCGMSPTIELLILFRGLQAVGAAMLAANSPAIGSMYSAKNFSAWASRAIGSSPIRRCRLRPRRRSRVN